MMFTQSVSPQMQSLIREPLYIDVAERVPFVRGDLKKKVKTGLIAHEPGRKNYTLVFDDDKLPENHRAKNVIKISSINEVILFIGLLGTSCEMYFSPEYITVPDERMQKLEGIDVSLAYNYLSEADEEVVSALLRKLPLDIAGLLKSPLAVKDEDVFPGVIDPDFIHKKTPANALLSEPYLVGRLVYYNMLRYTEELRFDHESDHVQGMLLLEAMRQSGLATTHLMGKLPKTGAMTLTSYCTNFYNYIEHDAPVILRAYTSYSVPEQITDQDGFVICQAFQWGKLCAEATLGAVAFLDKDRYKRHRSISQKLSARNKRQFASKVEAIS